MEGCNLNTQEKGMSRDLNFLRRRKGGVEFSRERGGLTFHRRVGAKGGRRPESSWGWGVEYLEKWGA
jgi:hypothetical protein